MKEFTTNVEDLRLETEETIKAGPGVHPLQIWRDATHIPEEAPSKDTMKFVDSDDTTYKVATVLSVIINGENQDILQYYKEVPLTIISGTPNCYKNASLLKDIVGPQFGKGYLFKIYIDGNTAPFGMGRPEFDVESGILKFNDLVYANVIKDKSITISFYKYVGRKGMTDVESLPFADNLLHFKSADDPSNTVTFKVMSDGHNDFILSAGKKAYDKGDAENTNVLVTQENISNVLYTYGTVNGGTW